MWFTFCFESTRIPNNVEFTRIRDYNLDCIDAFGVSFVGLLGMDGYKSVDCAVFILNENGTIICS